MRYQHVEYYLKRHGSEAERILELGCGAGEYRELFPAGSYCGTDVPNAHYQTKTSVDVFCSASTLPFADETFDLAFSQAAIDYMEDIHGVMREAFRTLKPGGILLTFTYNMKTLTRIHSDAQVNEHPAHQHYHIFCERQFMRWLRQEGFRCSLVPSDVPPVPQLWKRLILSTPPLSTIRRSRMRWRTYVARKPR